MNKNRLIPIIVLTIVMLSSLLGTSVLPSAKGQFVGEVCLTPASATACPAPPVTVTGPVGSQLFVPVLVQGSDVFNGFDITLKTNHTILVPAGISLTGSLLTGGSVVLECVGTALKTGPGCSSTDVSDTLHLVLTGPLLANTPVNGLLFTAIFNITSNVNAVVSYQTGCTQSSVSGTSTCVLFSSGSLGIPLETVQSATYTATPSPTFTITSFLGFLFVTKGTDGNTTISVTSLNGFTGNVALSVAVNSTAKHLPTFSINPSTIAIAAGGSNTALFLVSTRNNADRQAYNVTITAAGGAVSESLKITVNVIT